MSSIVPTHTHQLPWVLMAALAGAQIFAQEFGLSAWRGGGYGMYSTFHPNQRGMASKADENWVLLDPTPNLWGEKGYPLEAMDRYKRFPISRYTNEIRLSLDKSHKNTQFGCFVPHFDPSTGLFTRQKYVIRY